MPYHKIIYETNGAVATITLNDPEKLNPLGFGVMTEMDKALTEAEDNDQIKVIIFKGAGKSFCSGHDLREVYHIYEDDDQVSPGKKRRPSQRARLRVDLGKMSEEWRHLVYCWKPTIAQVHGYCIEGGLYLSIFCDITIASEDSQMGFLASKLTGHAGVTWVTPHMMFLVGPKIMRELYLTGKLISGKEAEKIGLINRAVPAETLNDEVQKLAKIICGQPRDGIAIAKAFTRLAYERMGIGEGLVHGGIGHTLFTNIRFDPDEFNFIGERGKEGVSKTIKKSHKRDL